MSQDKLQAAAIELLVKIGRGVSDRDTEAARIASQHGVEKSQLINRVVAINGTQEATDGVRAYIAETKSLSRQINDMMALLDAPT